MTYKGLKPLLLPLMKVKGEEFDNLLKNLESECIEYKPYCNTYRVYGIKC